MKGIKTQIDILYKQAQKLRAKGGKTRNELNVIKRIESFYKGVNKYLQEATKSRFVLVSDGKAKPPTQARQIEEEADENEKVVIANNAETPKARKAQAKKRKARKATKKTK